MFCEQCGKKLEDHEYVNNSYRYVYENPTTVTNTVSCTICGKKISEHNITCGYCKRTFCGSHQNPRAHDCPAVTNPVRHTSWGNHLEKVEEKTFIWMIVLGRIFLFILGIAVMIWGWGLADGNRSGMHPTFPFAGAITSFMGIILMAVAARAKL